MAGLASSARSAMTGPPIYFKLEHAEIVFAQFQETASHRGWTLEALSIMGNHFHMVIRVSDDPAPRKVLADFKAYASRALNRRYGKPASETWWTENGSTRKLGNERAIADATNYVLYKQPNPLLVWSPLLGRLV
jgi:REP element-mobilizing transposase RayT